MGSILAARGTDRLNGTARRSLLKPRMVSFSLPVLFAHDGIGQNCTFIVNGQCMHTCMHWPFVCAQCLGECRHVKQNCSVHQLRLVVAS